MDTMKLLLTCLLFFSFFYTIHVSPMDAIQQFVNQLKNNTGYLKQFIPDADIYENAYKTTVAKQWQGQKTQIYATDVSKPIKDLDPTQSKEAAFLAKRQEKSKNAITQFLELPDTAANKKIPVIAVAMSGGGYRAMITTSGFFTGLTTIGLFDGLTYISALSGSTWWLGPWIFMQKPNQIQVSIDQYKKNVLAKIEAKTFDPFMFKTWTKEQLELFGRDIILPTILFNQPFGLVNMYGGLLADVLLHYAGPRRFQQHLSEQWNIVNQGLYPWPIYTAVSMHKINAHYIYNWYEFNPEEVRNIALNLAIPSFTFGSTFNNGNSTEPAPELSFSFQMGIFGSAFAINAKDLKRIMYPETSLFKKKSYAEIITEKAINFIAEKEPILKIGTKRIDAGIINNPFKGYTQSKQPWLYNRDYLAFIDAGIDYNIPLLPLIRPERRVDLILVGDASSQTETGLTQIELALHHIQTLMGITYKKDMSIYENAETYGYVSNLVTAVYRPSQSTIRKEPYGTFNPPIIVYFNFLKDSALINQSKNNPILEDLIHKNNLLSFDPIACLAKECDTFNFNYSAKDFMQLSSMMDFNVQAHKKLIQEIIREVAVH